MWKVMQPSIVARMACVFICIHEMCIWVNQMYVGGCSKEFLA